VTAEVESARRDWEDAYRRLEEETRDVARAEALRLQFDAVLGELRKRIGPRFTLQELASAYSGSEAWVRSVLGEQAGSGAWYRTLAIVEGAAFHLYSRAAVDYEP
jgi:hypothetical protein